MRPRTSYSFHPRMRGEDPVAVAGDVCINVSPPYAGRRLLLVAPLGLNPRFTPVCGEKTSFNRFGLS